MGANYSKLDDSISTAAYDDQELKDMLHDIIANDTESFESVNNDDDFWVIPEIIIVNQMGSKNLSKEISPTFSSI